MKDFEEKTIKETKIFDGKIISLQVDDVRLPDGNRSKREIVKHPGAVAIIAVTDKGKIILVKQYRKPLERSLIEIPAGRIEEGEDPKVTAIRELEEETGYTTDDLKFVTSFYTSPGFANEIIYLYISDNLQQLKEPVQGDEDEFIELIELNLDEAIEYVQTGKIKDAKTNYAVLYLQMMKSQGNHHVP